MLSRSPATYLCTSCGTQGYRRAEKAAGPSGSKLWLSCGCLHALLKPASSANKSNQAYSFGGPLSQTCMHKPSMEGLQYLLLRPESLVANSFAKPKVHGSSSFRAAPLKHECGKIPAKEAYLRIEHGCEDVSSYSCQPLLLYPAVIRPCAHHFRYRS